jgi:hypothetical protein
MIIVFQTLLLTINIIIQIQNNAIALYHQQQYPYWASQRDNNMCHLFKEDFEATESYHTWRWRSTWSISSRSTPDTM